MLLSIAIPTYNRASILNESLSILLPQIYPFKDKIELIISDNASTDNTQKVIQSYTQQYPDLNIMTYLQTENTGYYGNFRKCRELSTGRFLWILSDNDHLNDGLMKYVFNQLERNNNCSAIFLKDWATSSEKVASNIQYRATDVSKQELVKQAGYKLTLISAVIIRNNKIFDDDIFDNLKGNTFIGFMLFLVSMSETTNAIIVEGVSLLIADALVSFNVFTSFASDLVNCVKYARMREFVNEEFENALMASVILNNSRSHYITYKTKGTIYAKKCGDIKDVEKILTDGFGKYDAFQKHLSPLFSKSRTILFIKVILSKLNKRIHKHGR